MQVIPIYLNGVKDMNATRTQIISSVFHYGHFGFLHSSLFTLEKYLNKSFAEKEELLILITSTLCATCRAVCRQKWFKGVRDHLDIPEDVS